MQQQRANVQSKASIRPSVLAVVAAAILAIACASPEAKKQKYFESGNAFLSQGKHAEAIIQYRNAIAIDARFGAARKRLAEAYSRTGNAKGALDEYVRAADSLPGDVDVQLDAGQLLLAFHKFPEAVERADAALRVDPKNVSAHVLRGTALAGSSSFDDARKAIDEAIRLEPARARTYSTLGDLEFARGRRNEAESAFRRATELAPNDVAVHLALGNFYTSTDRPRDAEQAFQAALKLEPTNSGANRFLASLMMTTGRRSEAEAYLRQLADSKNTSDVFALADYYVTMGRPKDAISRLQAIENARGNPVVAIQLAKAHAAADEQDAAQALVADILRRNAKDADAHLLNGQLLLQKGRRDEAFDAIRAAVNLNPSSPDAHLALGRLYAERGDNVAAQASLNEVLRLNPRSTQAQVQLARLHAQAGKPAEAQRTAEEAARNNPKSLGARVELVRSLIAARNVTRAQAEIDKLHAEYPDAGSVYVQEAKVDLLKNDLRSARAALERAQQLTPQSSELLEVFVALDLRQNDAAAVKARIEKRLQIERTPEIQLVAARAYVTMKDFARAEKLLRAIVETEPSLNEPYALLGAIYASQNKLDQAITEFEALAKRLVKPVGPLTMVGMIYAAQGKRDLARKRYEEVMALDSRAAAAANNLAWLLADSGEDLDRALQLAQGAVAASPDTPEVIDTLGWVYYKKNQPELAIQQFLRCVEKAPAVADYHLHLGLAYTKAGETAKARSALLRALGAQPSPTVAAEAKRLLAAS